MTNSKLIIGIVGPLASGKGAIADYFRRNFGAATVTLSYFVHEALRERGVKDYTRADLQDMGNELRQQFGNQILAEKAIQKIDQEGNSIVVIEGIRNPKEVEFLRKQKHFYLLAVNADNKVRFSRLTFRNKPWDPTNWRDFMKTSRRDLGEGEEKSGQQVKKCMGLADFAITNNRDLAYVYRQMERVVFRIKRDDSFSKKILNHN